MLHFENKVTVRIVPVVTRDIFEITVCVTVSSSDGDLMKFNERCDQAACKFTGKSSARFFFFRSTKLTRVRNIFTAHRVFIKS